MYNLKIAPILNLMVILITIFQLTGCATSSVFTPYPQQLADVKEELASGQYIAAQEKLSSQRQSADKLLYLMERGRVSQIMGDVSSSIVDFEQAIQQFEAIERKAKITASGAVGQAGALVANDNVTPYVGSAYERIFVHAYQALNYLAKGDLESAGVEVRRANLEQMLALKKYEDELGKLNDGRESKRILNGNSNNGKNRLALSRLSGEIKNSFQNAYTFYISGLIYEALGEENDAYIDYKKALEIFPDNKYVLADVVRLAERLSMKQDLQRYQEYKALKKSSKMLPNEGRIVVLFEYDYVPKKVEILFPLWVFGVMHSIAFPSYVEQPYQSKYLSLTVDNENVGDSEKIVDVSALAAKSLEERMPMIMVRQVMRIAAREQLLGRAKNSALSFIGSIANLLLNRADLRSWLTLPANAQILHVNLVNGSHTIGLQLGKLIESKEVDVVAGQTLILHVIALNGRLYVNSIKL